MEEFDSHTEHASDQIQEHATESKEKWIAGAALTAAILAAFAAITSLMSGHHEHEAMIEQVRAADQWAFYQAEGIKSSLIEERLENVANRDSASTEQLKQKLAKYRTQRERLKEQATQLQAEAEGHDQRHFYLAGGVTFFQVAIAIVAVSVLTRRRSFWYFGMVLGGVALACLIMGQFSHPKAERESEPAAHGS